MKFSLLLAAVTASYLGVAQSSSVFMDFTSGLSQISSNNTLVSERIPGSQLRAGFGYNLKNVRLGFTTAQTSYVFSNSDYTFSSAGLLAGYGLDFKGFGLNLDALVDYRLSTVQRVSGTQINATGITPVDVVLKPSLFVRPLPKNPLLALTVGYELGMLDMDSQDASAGISSKHRALTLGARIQLDGNPPTAQPVQK
jgi:hypothetical protein